MYIVDVTHTEKRQKGRCDLTLKELVLDSMEKTETFRISGKPMTLKEYEDNADREVEAWGVYPDMQNYYYIRVSLRE